MNPDTTSVQTQWEPLWDVLKRIESVPGLSEAQRVLISELVGAQRQAQNKDPQAGKEGAAMFYALRQVLNAESEEIQSIARAFLVPSPH